MLYSTAANVPLFYGLIKLHKIGHPIRPIVSFCGSPAYQLSKFLCKLITPLTNSAPQKLRNSTQAKAELESVTVPDDCILVSFDVKSLYTSIPIELALSRLRYALDNNNAWKLNTCLDAENIIKLVELCCSQNIFQFNNQLYK